MRGPGGAILMAYDIIDLDGQDVPLSLWKSAGSAWRGCYRAKPRRCETASN
jgi:hypothetical protein